MTNRTRNLVVVTLGIFILVGLGILGSIVYFRAPAAHLPVPPAGTLFVTLLRPENGSSAETGVPVTVSAEAIGTQPVQALELWVDGEQVIQTSPPSTGMKQFNTLWNWKPEKEGEHLLVARARDASGQVLNSNVVRVLVKAAAAPSPLSLLPETGQTLTDMAVKYKIPPLDLAKQNPGINPDTPLPAGKPVILPYSMSGNFAAGTSPALGWPDTTASNPPPPPPPPGANPAPDPQGPPGEPFVSYIIQGCDAQVEIQTNDGAADGYRLYVVPPGALEPELLGTFGKITIDERHSFTHKNLFGMYTYFAEAFNSQGTVQGKTIILHMDSAECAVNAKPPANVKFITGYGFDKIYCYITNVGTNVQIRMPIYDDSFIPPMSADETAKWAKEVMPEAQLSARSVFDLAPYMPALFINGPEGATLRFECWGWGGEDLYQMGYAQKTITAADLNKITIIEGDQYQVVGVFGGTPLSGGKKYIELPRPTSLKYTGDPERCALHFSMSIGKSICETFLKSGKAALVWAHGTAYCPPGTENSCTAVNDIDGFHIYHTTLPVYKYVYGANSGANVTAGFVDYPDPGVCVGTSQEEVDKCAKYNFKCYSVRAYKGSLESLDSDPYCIQSDVLAGTKTITLSPSNIGVREVEVLNADDNEYAGPDPSIPIGNSTDGNVRVGYIDFDDEKKGAYWDEFWGQFKFDLAEVKGKPIQSASLTFSKLGVTHTLNTVNVPGFNCVRSLGVSLADEFAVGYKQTSPIYQKLVTPLPDIMSGDLMYDVTDVVRAWTQGQLNTGFVLDGRDPKYPPPHANNVCINQFGNFRLEITYFPNP